MSLQEYSPIIAMVAVVVAAISLLVNRRGASKDWLKQARYDAYIELDNSVLYAVANYSAESVAEIIVKQKRLEVVGSLEQYKAATQVMEAFQAYIKNDQKRRAGDTAGTVDGSKLNLARSSLSKSTRKAIGLKPLKEAVAATSSLETGNAPRFQTNQASPDVEQ